MLRVLLADDQQLVRAGFALLLERADDIEVVGEADDGEQAVALVRKLEPDVVLMDVRMPRMDGIEATRIITSDPRTSSTRVAVLTTFEIDEYVFNAIRAGASGFLLKNTAPEDLRRAVRTVAAGEALLSPSVTRRLIEEFATHVTPVVDMRRLDVLTDREREVVELVARGHGNDEIARRLFLSPATVKTHVSRAMTKLGVHERAQLVVIAYESGLVTPGKKS
jgi:DNA-binding NarL/FixJ family response regulator